MAMRSFALCLLGLAASEGRSPAFGWHRPVVYPVAVYSPAPVWVFPEFAWPVYEYVPDPCLPIPCCPADPAPVNPPRLQVMPSEPLGITPPGQRPSPPDAAIPRSADPTTTAEKPAPLPAIPRPGLPTAPEEPLQFPREATPPTMPKLNPPNPPAGTEPANPDDNRFPPLKLTPPPEASRSESRYSPVADSRANRPPRVEVYPLDGPVQGPRRTVGFHNRSGHEVQITVQGETVTLAGGQSVTARVPGRFTWRLGNEPERATELPEDSPGAEVVIRR